MADYFLKFRRNQQGKTNKQDGGLLSENSRNLTWTGRNNKKKKEKNKKKNL